MTAGRLYLVATPIGNLEDMTYRAVRVLGEVDVIAAEDTRTARALLAHFGVKAPKVVAHFAGNEATSTAGLIDMLRGGDVVAFVSEAGMPSISDPGQRLTGAAIEAGIEVEVVPGASAAITALVGSGLATDSFLFAGFLPRGDGPRRQRLGQLRAAPHTLVFYESPERIGETLTDMADAFGGERRAVLARELTKKFEQWRRGTLIELGESVAAEPPRGECCVVVEAAAAGEADIDIEAEIRTMLADGLGPKDCAARLVTKTGKPRRVLYQLALSLKRDGQRAD